MTWRMSPRNTTASTPSTPPRTRRPARSPSPSSRSAASPPASPRGPCGAQTDALRRPQEELAARLPAAPPPPGENGEFAGWAVAIHGPTGLGTAHFKPTAAGRLAANGEREGDDATDGGSLYIA